MIEKLRHFYIHLIILILTVYICYIIGSLLLINDNRTEWFSSSVFFIYSIGFTFCYIVTLTIIGFLFRFLKRTVEAKTVFKMTKLSAIILFIFLVVSLIISQNDYYKWKVKSDNETRQREINSEIICKKKLDSLNKIIELQPHNFNALFERGLMKKEKNQYEASIDDYRKALKIKPNDFNANLEIGVCFGLLGKKVQQDSFYRLAARIDTNSYFARSNPQYLK